MYISPSFSIETNRYGRKILVVDGSAPLHDEPGIMDEDFEAIFIHFTSPLVDIITAVRVTCCPITVGKCWLKPLFVNKAIEESMHRSDEVIDGYISDIESVDMEAAILRIQKTIQETGLKNRYEELSSANIFFTSVCRYLISRRNYEINSVPLSRSIFGISPPLWAIFSRMGLFTVSEYIVFVQQMLERGFLQAYKFIDKVHLCPECMSSHLLFIERCPHCNSSNISTELIIHHFRCANASPESTYEDNGVLRCPKCRQYLRHLGVDYDRPASAYNCLSCKRSFLHSSMSVTCTKCETVYEPGQLISWDIYNYRLTELGIKEFSKADTYLMVNSQFYDGYIPLRAFENRLRVFTHTSQENDGENLFAVLRLWILSEEGKPVPCSMIDNKLADIFRSLGDYKITNTRFFFYIMTAQGKEDFLQDDLKRAGEILSKESNDRKRYCQEILYFKKGDDIEAFIKNLSVYSSVYAETDKYSPPPDKRLR